MCLKMWGREWKQGIGLFYKWLYAHNFFKESILIMKNIILLFLHKINKTKNLAKKTVLKK